MRRLLFIIIAISLFKLGYSQNNDISIAVVVPKQNTSMDKNTFSILKNKIENAMTNNDVSTAMYSGIVLYPILNVVSQNIIEGGDEKDLCYRC